MAHDVFISYCSQDKPIADAVCATLESQGMRCWIAPRDILPGVDWGEAIVEAINESRAMLLVFSSKANASQQIKREVERAVHRGIPLIPLRLDDVAPSKSLEYFISTPHWLDALTPPLESHLQRLAEAVKLLLQRLDGGNRGSNGAPAPGATSAPGPAPAAGTTREQEPPRIQPSAAPRFCIHCGARHVAGNRFCTGCGKPSPA
jgi:TIR domain-containing protein